MLTVITGPPCSGKTTYVRAHAQPGDVVIDYDALAQALGSGQPHGHPDPVRFVAIEARAAAIREAIVQHSRGHTVWIVDGSPSANRLRDYQRVNAHVVALSAEADELHRRASAERPPLWHKLIDDWRPTATVSSRKW